MRKKRTKIVATISDKRCDPDFISELYQAGMDVVRINSAHLDIEGALKIVRNVRIVSDKIAILIDTKGPEIRTTLCDAPVELKKADKVMMAGNPGEKTTGSMINVSYRKFAEEVPEGCEILIDDGDIGLRAVKRSGEFLECVVEDGGILGSRKSVNIPGVKICLPSLTEKDRRFIRMVVENDLDVIAHSFVRTK